MIKAVIFDFDGVILESTGVKTAAFRELFSGYPDLVDDIVAYHVENGGISRFVKFRHIYGQMLNKDLPEEEEQRLGERFTALALEEVLSVPYVAGAREFLTERRQDFLFFVASGTPDGELSLVIEKRGMQAHFDGVYGSPRTKKEIIDMILREHGLRRDEVVFVGDANSDRLAAREAQVEFIFRHYDEPEGDADRWSVPDLTGLSEILDEIEERKRSVTS